MKKRFRVGMYTTTISLAAIALTILINLFVNSIPDSVTKIDMTSSQMYSIGEQSVKIAKSIDHDVSVYLLAQNGNELDTMIEFLNRYSSLNSHIKVRTKDPVLFPNFAAEYTSEAIEENSVLVVDEVTGRNRYLPYSNINVQEMTGFDYETYSYQYEYYFDGENQVTSALNYVAGGELPVMYQLTGHGDAELPVSLKDQLADDNVMMDSLNLVSEGSIPEDCASLLILNPSSDLSANETEIILSYLKEGGKALIITDNEYYTASSYKNLASILENYGVTTVDGMIVEGDGQHYAMYASYLLPEINTYHEITSPLSGRYNVFFPYAQGILVEETDGYVNVTSLIDTTSQSYSKVAAWDMTTYEKEEDDIDGPFSLGVVITETVGETAKILSLASNSDSASSEVPFEDETRIVYFSSEYFIEGDADAIVSGANHDLFLNCVGWLCDREETISIRSKLVEDEYLLIDSLAATLWEILLIGILPVAVIVTGIVVCIRRSRRSGRAKDGGKV